MVARPLIVDKGSILGFDVAHLLIRPSP
jgi:hypothetical protein